ncbi:MAG: GNAT family N-acetyltransferase [Saprospiraceae bacterium]
MKKKYLFLSNRMGFRNWQDQDLMPLAHMNQNPEVMRFFPRVQTLSETKAFIQRMDTLYQDKGYAYFAVDRLEDQTFIGFIGLAWQTFVSPITPCVDIGWRLAPTFWGHGYATEGAQRCLEFGFQALGLQSIKAFAPLINQPSIRVMQKIGMQEQLRFKHPALKEDPRLEVCVAYEISNKAS